MPAVDTIELMRNLLLLLVFSVLIPARADLLYDLSPFDPELAFASDAVPGQFNNQRLAETFTLTNAAAVNEFRWWGRSEGAVFSDLRNFSSFTMRVYDDNDGLPGNLLFTQVSPTAALNPIQVATDPSNRPIYLFDGVLGAPLALAAGSYWFSVGATAIDPNGDGFYWQAAIPTVSGNFAADAGVNGTWNTSGFADLSFQVYGAPVPEPTTLVAVLMGLAGAVALRRNRSSAG